MTDRTVPTQANDALVQLQSIASSHLSPTVLACLASTLSPNTWLAYRRDLEAFLRWGGQIPCTPELLAEYAASSAARYAPATIRRRVAGISAAHVRAALSDPARSTIVRAVLRGIQRQAKRGQKQATPLLPIHLKAMVRCMAGPSGDRDRALLLVGFAGALRRSELVAIDVDDLSFFSGGARLHVRRSKTDQSARGRSVFLPLGHGLTCPITAVQRWLERSGITSGPLFVSLHGEHANHGKRLSPPTVSVLIKRYAARIGVSPQAVSGHSLRSGWITAAAAAGASDHQLRQHSGHKTPQMVARYIRMAAAQDTSAVRSLL